MANAVEKALSDLLVETISGLRKKIEDGEATASDYKNAIELLKNNGITFDTGKKGEIPDGILDDLPFESDLRVVK